MLQKYVDRPLVLVTSTRHSPRSTQYIKTRHLKQLNSRNAIVYNTLQRSSEVALESGTEALSIQQVAYEEGTFSIQGRLIVENVPPERVYEVLTDYTSLPRVFHNVQECAVQWGDDGEKCLIQRCSWQFLIFRGSFVTELAVEELEESMQLSFSLNESAFMRKFVGSWDIRPTNSGSEILHSLAVAPTLAPPQKIGDLTKRIFVSQVKRILKDLKVELERSGETTAL